VPAPVLAAEGNHSHHNTLLVTTSPGELPVIMKPFSEYFDKIFNASPSVDPGIYHFPRQESGGKTRIHLRVDEDKCGLLIINANKVIHLNPSAAMMAYLHLKGYNPTQISRIFRKKFKVTKSQAENDYQEFSLQLEELMDPHGGCPICDLDLETTAPFSAKPSAPYRMDLALTYRCNNNCSHCYNARSRRFPEMAADDWMRIIDIIWDLKIPHIVFTGGEPTLYEDLPKLIAYAEHKGLITGLNTNGRRLSDPSFLDRLVSAGLDHVQITLESHDAVIHDHMVAAKGAWEETVSGLKNVVSTNLYLMTNTTLLSENYGSLEDTLLFLADLNVPTVGLNALIYAGKGETVGTGLKEEVLPALLETARTLTESNGQRLIWYTPTQYCHFNPIQLDLGVKGCTAALYNMCIEPNGDVLPCQSYYHSLGNLLTAKWQEIWEHPLALELRNRTNIPEGCKACDFLPECGGGCPLARDHQSINPIQSPILKF
jgi:radical SAM protein with 4Fe4S-binding SPASM domain